MSARTLRKLRPWVQLAAFVIFVGAADRRGADRLAAGRSVLPARPAGRDRGHDRRAANRARAADRRGGDAGRPRCSSVASGAGGCVRWARCWMSRRRGAPSVTSRILRRDCAASSTSCWPLSWLAALLGNLTFLIFDPITLIYRTAATALWPALVALISGVEIVLYRLPFLQGTMDRFEGAFRGVHPAAGTAGLRHGRAPAADLCRHPGVERDP